MTKDYYLVHHGIKGQKWGIRRFQNEDGSYTEEGKKRYGFGDDSRISVERGNKTSSIYFKLDDENEIKLDMDDKEFRRLTEEAEKEAVGLLNEMGVLNVSYKELLDNSDSMDPKVAEELNKYLDAYTNYTYSELFEVAMKKGYRDYSQKRK